MVRSTLCCRSFALSILKSLLYALFMCRSPGGSGGTATAASEQLPPPVGRMAALGLGGTEPNRKSSLAGQESNNGKVNHGSGWAGQNQSDSSHLLLCGRLAPPSSHRDWHGCGLVSPSSDVRDKEGACGAASAS